MRDEFVDEYSEPKPLVFRLKNDEILYETDGLVAVNKPAGLLTTPDRFASALPCLQEVLQEKYSDIFVVHRIDKDTSGVILFAKNESAHRQLSLQFEERNIKKTYLALVNGILSDKEGIIDAPIGEDKKGKAKIDHQEGKSSQTSYKVIEEFRKLSLVEASPVTGRQHQIRVHFQSIGHPLAVDPYYGTRKALMLSEFKKKYRQNSSHGERPLLGRLSLHALRITFSDPVTGKDVTLEASLPKDFRATLNQLRKYY